MTLLEAHTRADQIVQHHLSDPLQLRSFVVACLLADARLAAQAATIALLRAECRAWRLLDSGESEANEIGSIESNVEASDAEIEQMWADFNTETEERTNAVLAARADTDAAGAMEDK